VPHVVRLNRAADRGGADLGALGRLGDGYRRLTFMMVDQEVVAASPSSVYRVLSAARW